MPFSAPPAASVTLSGLFLYPIKGCAGVSVAAASLDATGLRYDRQWMLVEAATGQFLTQRGVPQLARLQPHADADGLTVRTGGQDPLHVPALPDAALHRRQVTVWRFTGDAVDEGDAAAHWFSNLLGRDCRLVRTPDDFARRVGPKDDAGEDRVSFADGYPLLVASEASLDDLNRQLPTLLPMDRFRANVIVRGAQAWDEETWTRLDGAHVGFRAAKPCARCAVTTIDQVTGEKTGSEPLATLARLRRTPDGKVNFGMNLIHESWGAACTLAVGETLHIGR